MVASTAILRRPARMSAATHMFALGQAVHFVGGFRPSGGVYLITALLPPTGDSPRYCIRNDVEKFERVATQAGLEPVIAPARDESAVLFKKSFGADRDGHGTRRVTYLTLDVARGHGTAERR